MPQQNDAQSRNPRSRSFAATMRACATLCTSLFMVVAFALAVCAAPAFADEATSGSSATSDPGASSTESPTETTTPQNVAETDMTMPFSTLSDPSCIGSSPQGMRMSPDGGTLYVITETTVCVVDASTMQKTKVIDLPGQNMGVESAMTLSPDGSKLFVATTKGLAVIDATTLEISTLDVATTNFCVSEDGSDVYVVTKSNNRWVVETVSSADGSMSSVPIAFEHTPTGVITYAVSSGMMLVGASYDSTNHLVSLEVDTGKATEVATYGTRSVHVTSADGKQLYLIDSTAHNVLQAVAEGGNVNVISVGDSLRLLGLALSDNGSHMVVTTSGGSFVYNTDSGVRESELPANAPTQCLSQDGSRLYSVTVGDAGAANETDLEVRYMASTGEGTVGVATVAYDGGGAGTAGASAAASASASASATDSSGASSGASSADAVDVDAVAVNADDSALYVLASGVGVSEDENFDDEALAGRLIKVNVGQATSESEKSASENRSTTIVVVVVCVAVVVALFVVARLLAVRKARSSSSGDDEESDALDDAMFEGVRIGDDASDDGADGSDAARRPRAVSGGAGAVRRGAARNGSAKKGTAKGAGTVKGAGSAKGAGSTRNAGSTKGASAHSKQGGSKPKKTR